MEQLREWCTGICFCAVGCCAAQLLIAKNGVGKWFHLLTATLFICCLVTPLLNVRADLSLNAEWLPQEVVSDELEKRVNEQLRRQVEETVARLAAECLEQRGIRAEKITVQTDISSEGGIYIEQVVLTVDKHNVSVALAVRDVLKEQLGVPVTVSAA